MAEVSKEEGKSRNEVIEKAIAKLEKDYGKNTVVRIGEHPEVKHLDVISTGSILIDLATGIGGVPRGRIIELLGWESSGKTTIALHMIAEAQKKGLIAAFVDVEHAFDPIYAAQIGVDVEALYFSQPMSAEEGLEVVDTLVKTGQFGIIIIDSVAALVPKKELEGAMGASTIGIQSRLMGQAMRKLTAIAEVNNTLLVFINQIREKIGVIFGSPETTAGGNALKFYASMRFDVRKSLDVENELNTTRVKIIKNKLAPPFGKATVDVIWGGGYDKVKEKIDLGIEMGIISKSGSWYAYGTDKLGQGLEGVRNLFSDNPTFAQEIEDKIKENIKNGYKRLPEPKKEKDS